MLKIRNSNSIETTIIKKLLSERRRRRTKRESKRHIYTFNLTMKEVIESRINSKKTFARQLS